MRRQCPVLAAVQLLQVGLGVARIVVDGELAGHDVGGELVDKIDHVSQAHIARIVQVDEQQVLELDERFDVVADAQQPLVALIGGASYRADACSGMAWSYSEWPLAPHRPQRGAHRLPGPGSRETVPFPHHRPSWLPEP